MNKKPLILVTNDDGIVAPGIKALVEIVKEFGEVVVLAPDSPQSGKGHAITLNQPLRMKKVDIFDDVESYECDGTPADCVKLDKNVLLRDRTIDLCVSGINHGSNASINILYSGTMSAAMEASLENIDSVGFSLLDFAFEADFSGAQKVARSIIGNILKEGLRGTKLLNVNIPKLPVEEIKGIKICTQASGMWIEDFQKGEDPRGEEYYWLSGKFIVDEEHKDTDIYWLNQGYASVVPSQHDLTNYKSIAGLGYLEYL